MQIKMWCVCNKRTKVPIKVMIDDEAVTADAIGFATKKSLMKAIGLVEDDEIIRKIVFDY